MELKPYTGEVIPDDDNQTPALRPYSGEVFHVEPATKQNTSALQDFGTKLKIGAQKLPGALAGLADVPVGLATNKRPVSEAFDAVGKMTGFTPGKWAEESEKALSPEYQAGAREIDQAWESGGAANIASAYLKNPRQIAGLVAESVASMVAGGVLGRAGLAAGRATGAIATPSAGAAGAALRTQQAIAGGAAGEGAIIAGQTMSEIDENVEARRAASAALGTGVIGGALGYGGGKLAQRLGVIDPETAIAGSSATRRPPQSLIRRMLGGAISEGVFEELPQSVQEQMWQNWAEKKPLFENVPRAAVEGALAGSAMGAGTNVLSGGQVRATVSPQTERTDPPEQTDPSQTDPDIAGLLPAPVSTGTPSDRILQADVERANAIAEADRRAERIRATRAAYEEERAKYAPKPSEQMGIDPNNGVLSRVAAAAVDRQVMAVPEDVSPSPLLAPFTEDGARKMAQQWSQTRGEPFEVIPHPRAQGRFAVVPANIAPTATGEAQDGTEASEAEQVEPEAQAEIQHASSVVEPEAEIEAGFDQAQRLRNQAPESAVRAPLPSDPNEPDAAAMGIRVLQPKAAQQPVRTGLPLTEAGAQRRAAELTARTGQPHEAVPHQTVAGRFIAAPMAAAPDLAGDKINRAWTAFADDSGTLGIPRAEMPQIRAEHRGAMTNFMNARGVGHRQEEVAADSLRPTQAEFSPSKVKKAREFTGGDRSILVSADDYVLDGHHQWLAKREAGEAIKVIRLNAPIADLIPLAHEFPSSTAAKGAAKQSGIASPTADTGAGVIAQREQIARDRFVESAMEQFGLAQDEARAALNHLVDQRLIKIDRIGGQFQLTDGRLWDGEALLRAAQAQTQAPTASEQSRPAPGQRSEPAQPQPQVDRRRQASDRRRAAYEQANPFRAFLGRTGVARGVQADVMGDTGRRSNPMIPYAGPLFRNAGRNLDEVAMLAHEAGFLSRADLDNPADTGGTRKLADMIRAEFGGETQQRIGDIEAAAEADEQGREVSAAAARLEEVGIDTRDMSADEVIAAIEDGRYEEALADLVNRLADDARFQDAVADHADRNDVAYNEDLVGEAARIAIANEIDDAAVERAAIQSEDQVDYLSRIEEIIRDAGQQTYAAAVARYRQRIEGRPESAGRDGGRQEGGEREVPSRPAAAQSAEGELLSTYSDADLREREAAQTRAERAEAERQREVDQRALADAERDSFALTGSDRPADVQAAQGQGGLFDAPAQPAASAPQPDDAYEGRYRNRVARIAAATTVDEARAIQDEERADAERHFEGTDAVDRAVRERIKALAQQAREVDDEAARAHALEGGQWVVDREFFGSGREREAEAHIAQRRLQDPAHEFEITQVRDRGDVDSVAVRMRRRPDAPSNKHVGAAPQSEAAKSATPAEALKNAGLKVAHNKTRNGNDVWEVTGNTREHSGTLKALGGRWYGPKKAWSFYDGDPSAKIAQAIGGESGPSAQQTEAARDPAEPPVTPSNVDRLRERMRTAQSYIGEGDTLFGAAGFVRQDEALLRFGDLARWMDSERRGAITLKRNRDMDLVFEFAHAGSTYQRESVQAALQQWNALYPAAEVPARAEPQTVDPQSLDEMRAALMDGKHVHFDYAGADGRTLWLEPVGPGKGWAVKSREDDGAVTFSKGGDPRRGGFSKEEAVQAALADAEYRFTQWRPVAHEGAEHPISAKIATLRERGVAPSQIAQALRELRVGDATLLDDLVRISTPEQAEPAVSDRNNPTDAELEAAFDARLNERRAERAPTEKQPRAPRQAKAPDESAARPRKRAAGEAAKSAAKNTFEGIAEFGNALGELFGGKGKLSSGLTFDEETYAKAKPIFRAAYLKFQAAGADLVDVVRALADYVFDTFGEHAAANMKPYVLQFVKDVRDGKINAEGAARGDAKQAVAERFRDELLAGRKFENITEARKLAAEAMDAQSVRAGTPEAKMVDEAIEVGVVMAAREIVARNEPAPTRYAALVALYEAQPTLGVRTSTSVAQQAYSTPAPLAFAASQLAGIGPRTTVYEPSAGNGMLLIGAAAENVVANELNADRAAALRQILPDANVQQHDATAWQPPQRADVVIANPPFGAVKDASGNTVIFDVPSAIMPNGAYQTREIDHAVALRALDAMADEGAAVLILGGVDSTDAKVRSDKYNTGGKRTFFYNLYQQYNVVDHFTVSGDLYAKQGAGWPVDVVVIRGRGKSARKLPAANVPPIFTSWSELAEVLNDDYASRLVAHQPERGRSDGTQGRDADAGRAQGGVDRAAGGAQGGAGGARGSGADLSGRTGAAGQQSADDGRGGRSGGGRGAVGARPGDTRGAVSGAAGRQPAGAGAAQARARGEESGRAPGEVAGGRDGTAQRERVTPERRREAASEGQAQYEPVSKQGNVGTLVPANMREAVKGALAALEDRVGDLDAFVADELGYRPDELGRYFSAEQVDALALAIDNLKAGKGFIIGDQTGVGKGRINAGVIRWATRNGKTPIFVTEKPNLYRDMLRDLADIGEGRDMRAVAEKVLMTNADTDIPIDAEAMDWFDAAEAAAADGLPRPPKPRDGFLDKAGSAKQKERLAAMERAGRLDDPFQMVFTTYSQMQPVAGQPTVRTHFLSAMARGGILILDEAHNAGGQGANARPAKGQQFTRAEFVREIARLADGVFYSSATYAKRPDMMDLYFRTDLTLAVPDIKDLGETIERGGVPMQQVVAGMLTEAGQYLRRERSFDGVEYRTPRVTVDRQAADTVSGLMRDILNFSDAAADATERIAEEVKAEAQQVSMDGSTGGAGAESTNFTSVMHNLISQSLLAAKVDATVGVALEALKNGEKPVITVANTMESLINEFAEAMGINIGDPIALDFRALFRRYLEKSREIRIKHPDGSKSRHYLSDKELGPAGVRLYDAAIEAISRADLDSMPASPIDAIKARLAAEGYKVGEITGRHGTIDYSGKTPVYAMRGDNERSIAGRLKTIEAFNNGVLDVVILNRAGSTGLSLHASPKTGRDTRRRHMIVAQAEANIDTHMQMLGRVHRTGQVVTPRYSQLVADIPAEMRPAAVLAKKMASLNANTSAARSSALTAKDVVDFMNEYGDEVVAEMMFADQDMHRALGRPLDLNRKGDGFEAEGAARRVTGRIPLLPLAQQQAFYETVEQNYAEFVALQEAMGENRLEAKVLPLDAKPVDDLVLTEDDAGNASPFARGSKAIVYDVKRLGKPMTQEEIGKAVDDYYGGTPTVQKHHEVLADLQRRFDTFVADELAPIEEPAQRDATKRRLMFQLDKTRQALTRFNPGRYVSVTTPNGLLMYGRVLRVEQKGKTKNPAATGTWKMTIAVADASRQITLPLSQIALSDKESGRYTLNGENAAQVEEAFARAESMSREQRVILEGNLLAAYSAFPGGQITYFEDANGALRQGILMRRNFDLKKAMAQRAEILRSPEDAERAIRSKQFSASLTNADGTLTLDYARDRAYYGQKWRVAVPKSKAKGGKFFLDDRLRGAVEGGEFTSSGNRMVATVADADIGRFLQAVYALPEQMRLVDSGVHAGEREARYTAGEPGARARKHDDYTQDLFGNPVHETPAVRPAARVEPASAENRNLLAAAAIPDAKFATVAGPRRVGTLKSGFERIEAAGQAAHALAGLRKMAQEHFAVLVLDQDRRPISVLKLFAGATTQASVYPEVVTKAVYETPGAAHVWFAHNHPSGNAEPSTADARLTKALSQAFGTGTGIQVDGHVIIAGTNTVELDADGDQIGRAFQIPARPRGHAIPITERAFSKVGTLGEAISSPAVARGVVRDISDGKTGIVFLTASNTPVAFVPMPAEQMRRLRDGGDVSAAKKLFGAVARSNASAAILHFADDVSPLDALDASQNIYEALHITRDVRVLDAFHKGKGFSESGALGGRDSSGAFLRSSPVDTDAAEPAARLRRVDADRMVAEFVAASPGAPEIVMVSRFAQLPAEVQKDAREQQAGESSVKGAFHRGKIYVVAGNHRTIADLEATIFHEVLGHAGVRKMFGKEFVVELNKLFLGLGGMRGLSKVMHDRGMHPELIRYVEGVRAAQKANPARWSENMVRAVLTEEVFAHIAESGNKSMRDRFLTLIGQIRQWLRDHGFANLAKLGESDLLFMLSQARNEMRQGDTSVMREGVDASAREFVAADGRAVPQGDPDFTNALRLAHILGIEERAGVTAFRKGEGLRRATREEAQARGYVKAYRGVSRSEPVNDTDTIWLTTNREVAKAYANEVFGYDDPAIAEIWYDPKASPVHDISKMSDEDRAALGEDEFGNPQALGIYRNSDDSPLGSGYPHTAVHVPKAAVLLVDDGGANFGGRRDGPPAVMRVGAVDNEIKDALQLWQSKAVADAAPDLERTRAKKELQAALDDATMSDEAKHKLAYNWAARAQQYAPASGRLNLDADGSPVAQKLRSLAEAREAMGPQRVAERLADRVLTSDAPVRIGNLVLIPPDRADRFPEMTIETADGGYVGATLSTDRAEIAATLAELLSEDGALLADARKFLGDAAADQGVRFSRAAEPGAGITESALKAAFRRRMPGLSGALDAMLARGERGEKGGAVLIDSADPAEIARVIAAKTGRRGEAATAELRRSMRAQDAEAKLRELAYAAEHGGKRIVENPNSDQEVQVRPSRDGAPQGFYDQKSGLHFLIGPNLSERTALGVLLHEVVHGQQNADLDRRAMKMIDGRSREKTPELRAFLDRVARRMKVAGEAGNADEAMPYIVEQAVTEGRQAGHSAVDGKFLAWVDATLGKPVGNLIRALVMRIRGWAHRNGLPLKTLTVDDMVAIAQAGMRRAAQGKVADGDATRRSFAGASAATADRYALAAAQQRLEDGEDSEAVRYETGWHKGRDGRWRFEISDEGADIWRDGGTFAEIHANAQIEAMAMGDKTVRIGDVLDHARLFAAYPALADIELTVMQEGDGAKAKLIVRNGVTTVGLRSNLSRPATLSALLHELQHGIQAIEGFAAGGSQSTLARTAIEKKSRAWDEIDKINAALKTANGEQYADLPALRSRYVEAAQADDLDIMDWAHQQYRRLAGEVEARNTQARQKMTDAARRAIPPSATADTSDADVILVFNGTEMASAPMPENAQIRDIRFSRAPTSRDLLNEEVARWSGIVDQHLAGDLDRTRTHVLLTQTPASMQAMGLPNLQVRAGAHMMDYANARLTRNQMEGLPREIADPKLVYIHEGSNGLSINFVTGIERNGEHLVVALKPNQHVSDAENAHFVATVVNVRNDRLVGEIRKGGGVYVSSKDALPGLRAASDFAQKNNGRRASELREQMSRNYGLASVTRRLLFKSDLVNLIQRGQARYSFAGQNARTADTMALDTAQRRIEAGEDAESVRQDTGWFKGADGKWRFEINDADAKLKNPYPSKGQRWGDVWANAIARGDNPTLGSMLDHPALFAAYPQLERIPVSTQKGAGASYEVGARQINLGEDVQMVHALSTLLHEIQHGIQQIEGFARGWDHTSPYLPGMREQVIRSNVERLRRGNVHDPSNPFSSPDNRLSEEDIRAMAVRNADDLSQRYGVYRRVAGEVEARNTQARRRMTDAERRATPPSATADTADADVIVMFNGEEMQSAPTPANAIPPRFTRESLRRAVAKKFPSLSAAVDRMLARGEEGKAGGLVLIDSGNEMDIAETFASKTGRALDDAVQMFSDTDGVQGIYDPRSGVTFMILPHVTAQTSAGVLLHEMVHGQQRSDIDSQAVKLLGQSEDRLHPEATRAFLRRVNQRIEQAGERGNAKEAAAYIVEQAVTEGRQAGFSAVDGRFMDWVDATLGKRIGNIIRDFVAMVRTWAVRHGAEARNLTVDDLVAIAKAGVKRAARGDVRTSARRGRMQSMSDRSRVASEQAPDPAGDGTTGGAKSSRPSNVATSDYAAAERAVADIESLAEQHGKVYIRWAAGADFDLAPGALSRDYVSGETHNGLSAVEITADTHPADIARALSEYMFLRMKDGAIKPRVYLGERVGTDSDAHALIKPSKLLYSPGDAVVRAIDRDFATIFDLRDGVASDQVRLARITNPSGRDIVQRAMNDKQAKLDALISKHGIAFQNESSAPAGSGVASPRTRDDDAPQFSIAATLPGLRPQPRTTDAFSDLNADQRAFLNKVGTPPAQVRASEWVKARFERIGTKIRQGLVDRYAALKEMDEKLHGKDFIDTAITDSAWVLARMSSAASGAMSAMMTGGRVELDGAQRVVKMKEGDASGGLMAVLQKLGAPAEVERFFAWVAANRAEKLMTEGREHLFTADEIAAGKALNAGKTDGGAVRPMLYAQVFREFQQYRDDVLAIAEQTGIISAENRAMWRDEFYVPFYRVMEDDVAAGPHASKGLSRQEAYKKLKGGRENLNDLLENTLMNFHHLLSASMKNQAAAQTVKNAEKLGIARVVPESRRDPKNSTFVLANGERVFYEIDDPMVFEALTALSDGGLNNFAVRAMSAFKRMFTNMTTVTPQFIIANTLRDLMQATATTPTSKNLARNLVQGAGAYRDPRTRAEMLASGGAFSFGHIYGADVNEVKANLQRAVRGAELVSSPKMIPAILKKGWDAWGKVADASENVSRAATYVQNVEEKGRLRAAFEARDIMDFSSHGAWPAIRFLIRVVPFLNARLQGLDKIYRAGMKPAMMVAMGKGSKSDKQAAARFWTVTGALTLATIALYMANADDDEYRKLEDWQKDTYWFFRIGDNAFFLPKPFEVGAIATMAERTAEQFMDDKAAGKLFVERMKEMFLQTFAFNPVPQMFQPAIDIYSNKDAFTGRDIESAGMERLSPGLRARASTTAAGKAISAASRMFGDDSMVALSPVQADHLIRGYFGSVGATAAGMMDTFWRAANGEEAPDRRWSEYQPIRRFYRDLGAPVPYTRYSTLFYEGLRESARVYADVKELQALGRPEEARDLVAKNHRLLAVRQELNRQQRRLTEINNRITQIHRADRDGAWKRRELDRLNAIKSAITERYGKRIEEIRAAS